MAHRDAVSFAKESALIHDHGPAGLLQGGTIRRRQSGGRRGPLFHHEAGGIAGNHPVFDFRAEMPQPAHDTGCRPAVHEAAFDHQACG